MAGKYVMSKDCVKKAIATGANKAAHEHAVSGHRGRSDYEAKLRTHVGAAVAACKGTIPAVTV